MKFKGLILSIVKALLLLGIAGYFLLEFREYFVYRNALLSWGAFILIMFLVLFFASVIGIKGCLREIKKLNDLGMEMTHLNEQSAPQFMVKDQAVISFSYPKIFSYIVFVIAIVFMGMPFFAMAPSKTLPFSGYMIMFAIAGSALVTGVYLRRYVITIEEHKMVIKSFSRYEILFLNIRKIEAVLKGRAAGVVITLSDGKIISIDGYLKNFIGLVELLKSKTHVELH